MHKPIHEKTFKAFVRGDHAAFRDIYDAFYPGIALIAHQFVAQTDAADDIAAEAFLLTWEHHGIFETEKNLRAFLYTVTKNTCLDYLKHERLVKQKIPVILELLEDLEELPAEDDWTRQKLLESIVQAIARLPKRCRAVCQLAWIEGLKNDQIAERLHMDKKTVRNQKYEGLKRLRWKFNPT